MEEDKIKIKRLKHNIVVSLSHGVFFEQNILIKYTSTTSNVNYSLFYVLKILIRFGLLKPLKSKF